MGAVCFKPSLPVGQSPRRGDEVRFQIFHLEDAAYVAAPSDAEGYQESRVLDRRLRLRREPGMMPGTWRYRVDDRTA